MQNILHWIDIVDPSLYYTGEVKWLSASGEKHFKNIKRGDLENEWLELRQNWRDVEKIKDNTLPISTLFLIAMSD